MALTKEDLAMIGDGMVSLLQPVYDKLDSLTKDMKQVKKTQEEHGDKIDALLAEVHNMHQELGIYRDKTDSETEKIKDFVHIPSH